MITLIAAIGKNNEIGLNNHLLWDLKEDLKFFKKVTQHHKVVMGLNTYLSIGKALPNRENIVLSDKDIELQNVKVYNNITDMINKEINTEEEVFVIGGSSLYNYFYPLADRMYLTLIDDTKDADTYFPKIDYSKWTTTVLGENIENNIKYTWVLFERSHNEESST